MEKGERRDVYKVYDKVARWFAENRYTGLQEKKYLDALIAQVPAGGSVLDVGCGTGKPILEYLLGSGLHVTGIDASGELLAIARANFPSTDFILQDMRSLNMGRRFDAIIAWHSFFHLSVADQPAMFKVFEEHINPNGILLFTAGPARGEAWGMIGGENLFHASLDPGEYDDLLTRHHFKVLQYVEQDPDCYLDTVWMAAFGL